MRPYFYIANSVRDVTHIQIHGDSVSVDKKKRVEQEHVEEVAESLHSRVERVGLVPGCVPSGSGSENVHLDYDRLNQLYSVTQEARTGEYLSNIIYCVIFHTLSEWCQSPVCHFFDQMTKRFEDELSAEGMILRDEDGMMELKGRDWLADIESDEDAAEKISEEIQSDSKLLLVGVEEDEQRIRPMSRSKWNSERNERIRDNVRELNGHHNSIQLSSLQMGGGDCLLFVYSVRGDQSFDLDMAVP